MRTNRFVSLIQSNAREIKFFLGFIFLFVLLQSAYYLVRSYATPILVDLITTKTSSKLINLITPHEQTAVRDGAITDGVYSVDIRRGCEGIEGMLLLIAAICAYPAGIRLKITGIIGGILVLYGFNIARIVGLYYIVKHRPDLFDMMHIYVGQTVIIIIALFYFIAWINQLEKNIKNHER